MSDNVESTIIDREAEAETEAEIVAEAEAELAADVEVVAEAEEVVEAEAEIVAEAEAELAADVETVAEAEEAVEAEAEIVAEAEAELAADVETVAEAEEAVEAEAEIVAEAETAAETGKSDDATNDSESKRVVRTLAVGQAVEGVVKRTTDFGAFVDIGVGRDGLIHISELDVRRVGKVTDVVKDGQKVTAWIKKLDRARNRISLTLIPPGTKTIRDLAKGDLVEGKVTRIVPYGAFVDIGVGRDALLHVREMAEGYVAKPQDVVQEGEKLEARIIEVSRRRGRIDLSIKGLRPEPEAEKAAAEEVEEEVEVEDPYANVEVLSPMELAFKKAMSEGAEDVKGVTKKRSKRARRNQVRAIQDEIVSRTLDTSGSN